MRVSLPGSSSPLRLRLRLPARVVALPSAPIAAAGLVAGYGVAAGSGSRPLGGVVLAGFGLTCVGIWLARDGRSVALRLTATGLVMFAASHALGLAIGAWPAVLLSAAVVGAACERLSDAPQRARLRRAAAAAGGR
jgi:hypothetical protein